MEIGSIVAYTLATVPEGFLLCDGSAISRDDYSDLFDVIGTTYGSGDGSTTFNIPNLTGRVTLGISSGYAIGSNAGAETITLTETQIAAHNHSVGAHGHANSVTATTPSLAHTITQPVATYTQLNATSGQYKGSKNAYSSRTSTEMTRTNMSVTNHAATNCTMSGSVTAKAAYNSGSAGTGGAHNNLMPFLALTYIIRYAPDTPPTPRMLIYNGCMPVTAQGYYLVGTKQ